MILYTYEIQQATQTANRYLLGEQSCEACFRGGRSKRSPSTPTAYPTEAQERAKTCKAAGVLVKKKAFDIQDQYDDCATSLEGLGISSYMLKKEYVERTGAHGEFLDNTKTTQQTAGSDEASHSSTLMKAANLAPLHMYLGSEVEVEWLDDLQLPTTVKQIQMSKTK